MNAQRFPRSSNTATSVGQLAMGFDKDDTRPVVNTSKRTTKVNVGMVLAVLLFFAVAGIVVWAFWDEPARATQKGPGAE